MSLLESNNDRFQLPGFFLPYDTWDQIYPTDQAEDLTAVKSWSHDLMLLRERCMLYFINQITDKEEWTRKVHDESIVSKWRKESMEMNWKEQAGIMYGDMSEKMFEYSIRELRDKAALSDEHGIVPIFDVSHCVVKSDSAIPIDLKTELKAAVAPLENVQDIYKDWHPNSGNKVLDLVHPSLFPLIYKRSRILPDHTIGIDDCLESIGKGKIIPCPLDPSGNTKEFWSSKFQWLPCEVSFLDGANAQIDSYINNLHPEKHRDLYRVIEKVITKAVPLWNVVTRCYENGDLCSERRIGDSKIEYSYPEGVREDYPEDSTMSEGRYYQWLEGQRIYKKPEPQPYKHLWLSSDDLKDPLAFIQSPKKKIQVIVKLANIHLTPEDPQYAGGTWHVEGQLNEHIIATALYYYDNHNVTDSRLLLRTSVRDYWLNEEVPYEQGDHHGIYKIYGIRDQSPSIQPIGSVLTREDRLLAFPNGFQHRVGGFKLADPSQPGHRKILALFLVAPSRPIISTANVPPQQREWWVDEVAKAGGKMSELPRELLDMVGDGVEEFPIGMEEAKSIRLELMKERGRIDKDVMYEYEGEGFSFCEH